LHQLGAIGQQAETSEEPKLNYYSSGSSTPPSLGSIISQTSPAVLSDGRKPGHISIVKKVDNIDANTIDVYFFEQNWIWPITDKHAINEIAHSRKMRFTKSATGEWSGETKSSNKAIGWSNIEFN
jgi:hypothetical protein